MNDPYPPVVNVTPPPQDPEETKRVFDAISKRSPWSVFGGSPDQGRIIPPGPPGSPPTDLGGGDNPDEADPLPVPEISMSEAQEYMVKPEVLQCWKCGTKDGVRKLPENGAVLCGKCEDILKP